MISVVMVYHSVFKTLVRRLNHEVMTLRSLTNSTEDIVLTSRQGSLGIICLNNPSKLHALNLPMVEKISKSIVQMESEIAPWHIYSETEFS